MKKFFLTIFILKKTFQGFAKQVANEEDEYLLYKITGEVGQKSKTSKKKKSSKEGKTDEKLQPDNSISSWSTIEAFNDVFINFVKDFLKIIRLNNLPLSLEVQKRFVSISMQLWFKYLRESEIAFVVNEHNHSKFKLHPTARYRDKILLSENFLDGTEIPFKRHNNIHVSQKPNALSFGSNYTLRFSENSENISMDTLNHDPRIVFHRNTKEQKKKRKFVSKNLNKFLFENVGEKVDPFVNFIENISSENLEENEANVDENNQNDNDCEELMDDDDLHNLMKQLMPEKLKLMNNLIPFKKISHINNSTYPYNNDIICRRKLLALLFIVIRLFNFNIYLSDLIRWCVNGSIKYWNMFQYFKENRQIMWQDLETFRNSSFPNYNNILIIIRNMIVHCSIDLNQFVRPDIYALIERYIKDLNLPRELILVIKTRYSLFIDQHTDPKYILDEMKRFPPYDIFAMVAIISTLRDLFDLNGPNEINYNNFKNNKNSKLFIWPEWVRYSRIRWNLIKSFYLNIKPNHCDILDIDETIIRNNYLPNYFKDKTISKIETGSLQTRTKLYSNRFKLQELFENMFFKEENYKWKEKLMEKNEFPEMASFYPLTSFTGLIASKINNKNLEKLLQSNFRYHLLTPYMCQNFRFDNRSRFAIYCKSVNSKEFNFSDSFRHLLQLASFITCSNFENFLSLFKIAEKSAKIK